MTEVLAHAPGNPSSTHAEGAEARRLVEIARRQIADALGAGDAEIVFTAGVTEANNAAITNEQGPVGDDFQIPGIGPASLSPDKRGAQDGVRLSVYDSTSGDGGIVAFTELLDAFE